MNGTIDRSGRALVTLDMRSTTGEPLCQLTAWVDTAFSGELVVPRSTIDELQLPQSSAVMAGLADGTEVVLETFSSVVEWFGEERRVEVIASECVLPLLGVGLLKGCRLEIDYRLATLTID